MKNNKVARAISRAQKAQDRIAELEAELLKAEQEADRVLGEAVRLAVTNPRSKWAEHIDLTVNEFYSMVVGGMDGSDEPEAGKTDVVDRSDGEEPDPGSGGRVGDNNETGLTDVVGDRQGF